MVLTKVMFSGQRISGGFVSRTVTLKQHSFSRLPSSVTSWQQTLVAPNITVPEGGRQRMRVGSQVFVPETEYFSS